MLRILAEPSRMRLLALLENEELTVAELAAVTLLAQPRVSTHLAKLRDLGLVQDRKAGVQSYYRLSQSAMLDHIRPLWQAVKQSTEDAMFRADQERVPTVLAERARARNWADSVAGDMERHYSPGRTWEATARTTLQLLRLGDVLDVASGDGVLAEMLAPRAQSVTCVDVSERVVEAGAQRLQRYPNVTFHRADMHALPFEDASFDAVLLLHALTYTKDAAAVITELARVLRPQGSLVASTLNRHRYRAAVEPYGHVNMGFLPAQLNEMCIRAGLQVRACDVTSRESRSPHFEIITLRAVKA